MKGGLFIKENIAWELFQKTGEIRYYLLAKRLKNGKK